MRRRHMNVRALLAIAKALGVRSVMVVDPELVAEMSPQWEKRDATRARANRLAPLSATTIKRIVPIGAREIGRRSGAKRRQLQPEVRRKLAQAAARARWQVWD
jgi:hypothetical protein